MTLEGGDGSSSQWEGIAESSFIGSELVPKILRVPGVWIGDPRLFRPAG